MALCLEFVAGIWLSIDTTTLVRWQLTVATVKPAKTKASVAPWPMLAVVFVGECTIILFETLRRIFTRPREAGETLQQMSFIGVASVPIVALTTFASGAV